MIYGSSHVHLARDVTDLIGIRTLILRKYWQAEGVSLSYEEINGQKPAAPPAPQNLMLMGEQTLKERGRYATLWTYQGVGQSVSFKGRGNSIDFGFEAGFSQVPIQLHKNFFNLLDKYQGYTSNDGTTVIWPPDLNGTSSGGTNGTNKTDTGASNYNPMFGIQAFFEMDGIYRYRYAAKEFPQSLQKGVGFIASRLPGKPPLLSDGRNWLKAPANYQLKGNVYDITEYYWMSRRGGWPRPVYGRGGDGDDGGSGGGPEESPSLESASVDGGSL